MSGSTSYTVPGPDLIFGNLSSEQYAAGDTLSISLSNLGGVDSVAEHTLTFYDDKNTKIADINGVSALSVGMTVPLELQIPKGVVSGTYYLQSSAQDSNGDKSVNDFKRISVNGIDLSLAVTTSKDWYLSTEPVEGTTEITSNDGGLTGATLNVKVLSAAPAQGDWWDKSWKYRQLVEINVGNYERENYPISVPVNFTDEFAKNGSPQTFDENSLRVIEYDANGKVLKEIPSQLDRADDYDAGNNAKGNVYWIADGITPVGAIRHFAIYFDAMENGPKMQRDYGPVSAVVDNTNKFLKTDSIYIKWGGYGLDRYADDIITELRFDDAGSGSPKSGFDRLQDSSAFGSQWHGYLGGGLVYGFGGSSAIISKQGPVFVEFSIGSAKIRYFRDNKEWLETNAVVNYLYNFNALYDFVKAENVAEKTIINGPGWEGYYSSWTQPGYVAYRSSSKGIVFGAIASNGAYCSCSNKSSPGYNRALSYSFSSTTADPKIYWYSDATGNYKKISKLADSLLNKVDTSVKASEILSEDSVAPAVWEKTIPVNIDQSTVVPTEIDFQKIPAGKYYLQSSLISPLNQLVAQNSKEFYVVSGNAVLAFNTDKRIYKPDEMVTVTGEIRNLAATEMTNAALTLISKSPGSDGQTIYYETFNLSAGGTHPFSVTLPAESVGTVDLNCSVTQGNIVLGSVTDQYQVVVPQVSATWTAPNLAGGDAFRMNLELENTGEVDATTSVRLTDDAGQLIDLRPVTIPAGEVYSLGYTRQIQKATTYRPSCG